MTYQTSLRPDASLLRGLPRLGGRLRRRALFRFPIEEYNRPLILCDLDFRAVVVDTFFVLPFLATQRATDENLRAFREIFLGKLAELFVEDHHAVPVGLLLLLASLILPALIGGN